MKDSKALWLSIKEQLPEEKVTLGAAYSNLYRNDPKALAFGASRYKFVSKMLYGNASKVLEIGCGDAFGAPIVAQAVSSLTCTDIDDEQLRENSERLSGHQGLEFLYHDFRDSSLEGGFDAVYLLDVLEHIYPDECSRFLENVFESVSADGCAIVGVPNKNAEIYASEYSRQGHVNLMTAGELVSTLKTHWNTVFSFGMNDEVVHTGYSPMCHYLFAVASNKK